MLLSRCLAILCGIIHISAQQQQDEHMLPGYDFALARINQAAWDHCHAIGAECEVDIARHTARLMIDELMRGTSGSSSLQRPRNGDNNAAPPSSSLSSSLLSAFADADDAAFHPGMLERVALVTLSNAGYVHYALNAIASLEVNCGIVGALKTVCLDGLCAQRLLQVRVDPVCPSVAEEEEEGGVLERRGQPGLDTYK